MVEPLRHRQTKGAATDMFYLTPPRHISTLPLLCENSDVELSRRTFVSITLNKKRTALAGTVERRKERKQFCAFSARARFTQSGSSHTSGRSVFGAKRTLANTPTSAKCQ